MTRPQSYYESEAKRVEAGHGVTGVAPLGADRAGTTAAPVLSLVQSGSGGSQKAAEKTTDATRMAGGDLQAAVATALTVPPSAVSAIRCGKPDAKLCGERAGYAFHWCALAQGHDGDCRCACGHVFQGTPF